MSVRCPGATVCRNLVGQRAPREVRPLPWRMSGSTASALARRRLWSIPARLSFSTTNWRTTSMPTPRPEIAVTSLAVESPASKMSASCSRGDRPAAQVVADIIAEAETIARRWAARDPRVRVIENPARRIPAALNAGLRGVGALQVEPEHGRLLQQEQVRHLPAPFVGQGVVDAPDGGAGERHVPVGRAGRDVELVDSGRDEREPAARRERAEADQKRGDEDVRGGRRIYEARDPVAMASAFAKAVEAGRAGYEAGLMPRRDMAAPSTPVAGTPFF